jgi:hypothetical protein
MSEDPAEHGLRWLVAAEAASLAAVLALLAASLLGDGSFLASVSRPVRAAALAFVAVELAIPLWVYYDLRRAPEGTSALWVHAAVMPVLNLLGLVAYLAERRRRRAE